MLGEGPGPEPDTGDQETTESKAGRWKCTEPDVTALGPGERVPISYRVSSPEPEE